MRLPFPRRIDGQLLAFPRRFLAAVKTVEGYIKEHQIDVVVGFGGYASAPAYRAAKKLGYSNMPAVSGAGHDAVYMAKLAPSGMIFIPCKDGISHNEIEDAQPAHITAGCNVLLHAMLERAGVVPG